MREAEIWNKSDKTGVFVKIQLLCRDWKKTAEIFRFLYINTTGVCCIPNLYSILLFLILLHFAGATPRITPPRSPRIWSDNILPVSLVSVSKAGWDARWCSHAGQFVSFCRQQVDQTDCSCRSCYISTTDTETRHQAGVMRRRRRRESKGD